jgi:hypothetical protein
MIPTRSEAHAGASAPKHFRALRCSETILFSRRELGYAHGRAIPYTLTMASKPALAIGQTAHVTP